jgi:hypothetical protein
MAQITCSFDSNWSRGFEWQGYIPKQHSRDSCIHVIPRKDKRILLGLPTTKSLLKCTMLLHIADSKRMNRVMLEKFQFVSIFTINAGMSFDSKKLTLLSFMNAFRWGLISRHELTSSSRIRCYNLQQAAVPTSHLFFVDSS